VTDKTEIKQKIKDIYEVLPKSDDQLCGYRTCGEFARAVAEGRAPCHGCVSGGPSVAARVCEIMGQKVPEESATGASFAPFLQPGISGPRMGMGRGMGRGAGRGRGGRGGGRGRGRTGRW
jgi:hypothetical protein